MIETRSFTRKALRRILPQDAMFIWYGDDTSIKEDFISRFEIVVGTDQYGTAITSKDEKDWGFSWTDYLVAYDNIVSEYHSTQYQRQRAPEYPSIGDQLDALFHAGVFPPEMAAQIQAVKDKYPK